MGLIHIYCGDGKGKTTASCGLALRALGNDMKVVFCQFFKDGSSCEVKSLIKFENLTYFKSKIQLPMFSRMTDEQKNLAFEAYNSLFKEVIEQGKKSDLVIFDEIISAMTYKFLDETTVINVLKKLSETCEIVLTGRNPSENLQELADYISEIKKIKHPFDSGITARKGIEF